MAMREYIGARYVPRFMGTLDPTQQYDALDVVDNGAGTSYIAKKTVPPGTSLTDTNYWAIYGSTSGAIISLQSRVDALESDVSDLKTDIFKKYIFFGDSYGKTYVHSGVTIVGWLDKIDSVMGITKSVDSFADNGYGFHGTGTQSWESIITGLTQDDEISDVVFIGGTNDCPIAEATLETSIENTISLAKIKYPNARIWVGFISCGVNDGDTVTRLKTLGIYSRVACANGALFMNSLEYCLYNTSYVLSTGHPNNDGTDVMAAAISSILNGGVYDSVIPRTSINRSEDIYTDPGTVYGNTYFSVHNNDLSILLQEDSGIGRWAYILTTPKAIRADGNDSIVLGKLLNVPIQNDRVILGSFGGVAIWTVGKVRLSIVTMYIESGYLKADLLDAADLHNAYYNNDLSDTLTGVQISGCRFNIPLLRDGIE